MVGNTYLKTNLWRNEATLPKIPDKVGFKDYNLTVNGKEPETRIIIKTTNNQYYTETEYSSYEYTMEAWHLVQHLQEI